MLILLFSLAHCKDSCADNVQSDSEAELPKPARADVKTGKKVQDNLMSLILFSLILRITYFLY
jgi:hypothetical protein